MELNSIELNSNELDRDTTTIANILASWNNIPPKTTEVISESLSFEQSCLQQLRLAMTQELNKLWQSTEAWFEVESQKDASDGYYCNWKRCTKKVKGKGNFRKHLDWHINDREKEWQRLLIDNNEWQEIKRTGLPNF